jgi:two-component system, LuxR family, sensor kinase FixL
MRGLSELVPLSLVGAVHAWAQLAAILLLSLVLLAFYRLYRRPYLLYWGLSWLALAAYFLGGTATAFWAALFPSDHPARISLAVLILVGGYWQIVWLLIGLAEFVTGRAVSRRLHHGLLAGSALLAVGLALTPRVLGFGPPGRFLVQIGVRAVIAGTAYLVAAVAVLRMSRHAGVIGRRLMVPALVLFGLQQYHHVATYLGLGRDVLSTLLSNVLVIFVHGLVGGAMIVWLLEEERQRLVRASQAQDCVYRISEAARSSRDLGALFSAIHTSLAQILPARNFYIALFDEVEQRLSFPYFVDEHDATPDPKPLGKGLTEFVLRTRQPLLTTPKTFEGLVQKGEVEPLLSPSVDWLGAPLLAGERAIGVIALQTYDDQVRLGASDRDLLVYVSEQVASAIEARRAQDRLERSAEAYRRLFEANPVPLLVYDPIERRFLAVNDAAAAVFGYTREEFLRMDIPDLLVPEERDQFRSQRYGDERFIRRAGPSLHARKDGTRVELDITAHGLEWEGRPARVYSAVDVTEQRRAEAAREALIHELEAKNAELERFTYTVSHDLKSPLITIRGFLGFVKKAAEAGDAEALAADLARIETATGRMERLLNELLELSRIGRVANPSETIELGALAREAVAQAHGVLAERDVEVHIASDLPTVYGDRLRILEVVQNLVENAVKFMGDQARPLVSIGTRGPAADGFATVFVRDNGVGIPVEYQERVFRLFDKLDAGSPGTGVGLAVVRRILDVHGGHIWVESDGRARGSTFLFTLPVPPPG